MSNLAEGYLGLKQMQTTLPASFYVDPEHYKRELNAIWYRNWVYVCRSEELGVPRAFQTMEIGDQSILIVRDENNDLQAFHNTCRHRGSVLCTEKQGKLPSKSIICPYHAWAYSLQGELKRTSSKTHPDGFDKSQYPLYDVAVKEWKGFVFINLAGKQAPAFEDELDTGKADIDHWPLKSLKLGHRFSKTMECNWKIFWENFNECLHCPRVHPELCKLVPIYGQGYMEAEDYPDWPANAESQDPKLVGGMRDGAETWTYDGQTAGKPFKDLTEKERSAGYHYVVSRPSVFIALHVDYVRIVRLRPLSTEKTELQVEWLFTDETLADPSVDIKQIAAFAQLVMEQDAAVSEINQKGLHSIRHQQGILMSEENDVHNFQNWVREQLATL